MFEKFFNNYKKKRIFIPSKIFYGENLNNEIYECLKEKKIIIIVDNFFKNNSVFKKLKNKLSKYVVNTFYISGPPKIENINKIFKKINGKYNTILSVGGGTITDFSKAIIAKKYFGKLDGINIGKDVSNYKKKNVQLISLPTTVGSGAETSRYYVVFDNNNKKIHGKSWNLCSDYVFIDYLLIKNLPKDQILLSSFDCFIHYVETFICKNEKSWFNEILSLNLIPVIIEALNNLLHKKKQKKKNLIKLAVCSSLAGATISNVRTGSIHEAAGALLELTNLSHAETLYIFFEEFFNFYKKILNSKINNNNKNLKHDTIYSLIEWWKKEFKRNRIDERIKKKLKNMNIYSQENINYILNRVNQDKVWNYKESPIILSKKKSKYLIRKSLSKYK